MLRIPETCWLSLVLPFASCSIDIHFSVYAEFALAFIPQAGQRAPGDVPGEVHGDQEFYRMSRHYKSLKSWTVIFVGMESENSTVKGTSIRCISRDPQTHTLVQAFCIKLGANESQRVTHASPLVQW